MTRPGPLERGRPGRHPSSSRAAIEDAAGELFLENSYAGTSIGQIATRAGVSRASFFNYFAAKSDLLWGDVDTVVDSVATLLATELPAGQPPAGPPADPPAALPPMEGIRRALIEAAGELGADRIPLAASQWRVMDAGDELLASGFTRFARLAAVMHDYLSGRSARPGHRAAPAAPEIRAAAFAVAGAVAAAASDWATAGIDRGSLAGWVDRAVTPVCDGFARIFPES